MQEDRNIRQLHSSHITGVLFLSGIFFLTVFFLVILMVVWAAQMTDFQKWTLKWTRRLLDDKILITHDFGQFVWAVIYKPFAAQSISIYKMMRNGYMMVLDEMFNGDLISEPHQFGKRLTGGLKKSTHWSVCCLESPIQCWLGSNCSCLDYPWAKQEICHS